MQCDKYLGKRNLEMNFVMNKNIVPYGLTSQHTPVTKRAGFCQQGSSIRKKDRTSAVLGESFQRYTPFLSQTTENLEQKKKGSITKAKGSPTMAVLWQTWGTNSPSRRGKVEGTVLSRKRGWE